jgi:hypothetical protein
MSTKTYATKSGEVKVYRYSNAHKIPKDKYVESVYEALAKKNAPKRYEAYQKMKKCVAGDYTNAKAPENKTDYRWKNKDGSSVDYRSFYSPSYKTVKGDWWGYEQARGF